VELAKEQGLGLSQCREHLLDRNPQLEVALAAHRHGKLD